MVRHALQNPLRIFVFYLQNIILISDNRWRQICQIIAWYTQVSLVHCPWAVPKPYSHLWRGRRPPKWASSLSARTLIGVESHNLLSETQKTFGHGKLDSEFLNWRVHFLKKSLYQNTWQFCWILSYPKGASWKWTLFPWYITKVKNSITLHTQYCNLSESSN